MDTESSTLFCSPVISSQCYHVPYLSLNMFLGGDHRDRDSAMAYSKRSYTRTPGGPMAAPDVSPLAGMTTEMLAMLMASVIQGKVVAVYNSERQEVCQHLEHDAPASPTSSPQIASLQATVTAAAEVSVGATAQMSPQQLSCIVCKHSQAYLITTQFTCL